MSSLPVCPPGFDCAFANACPSPIVDCPPGFFCSSYAGFDHQGDLDYEYSMYKAQFGGTDDVDVTRKNAKRFIDPDRAIQNGCLAGFYCPDASTMEACPSDHWCPERTVEPQKCDGLSVCGEQSAYQVNFVNPLIMFILIFISLACSIYLTRLQQRRDTESHKKDPAARVASPVGDDSSVEDQPQQAGATADSPSKGKGQKGQKVDLIDRDGLFEVSFHDVHCVIPGTNRPIVPGASGVIPAGKISALMGPTASGKSTLTNILRHGSVPHSTGGTVTYCIRSSSSSEESSTNGDAAAANHTTAIGGVQYLTASQAQQFIGHVPQDDILDRSLTVRELFTFHAKTRSRVPRTEAQINAIVDEVLADLAIQHVADSIIGGGENAAANISGGQLKRVNIGCELVALSKPALLLLDEPTAGLDAAIAYELILTLESLKKRGITIFMVIQQPRAEIFERFDHLFLMNSVGGVVYEGPSSQAVSYLLDIGYTPNPEAFDADYCLDVLNGLRDPTSSSSRRSDRRAVVSNDAENGSEAGIALTAVKRLPEDRLDCTTLHLLWKEQHAVQQHHDDPENPASIALAAQKKLSRHESRTAGTVATKDGDASSSTREWQTWEFWQRLGYHTYLNARRLITIRLRNRTSLLVYIGIDVIMAVALSSGFTIYLTDSYRGVFMPPVDEVLQGFYPSALQPYGSHNAASMGFAQLMFFMSSALGSSASLSAVPVFSGQAILAQREHAAGVSAWSFAFGRILGDVVFVILHGFVYAGVWMLFGHAGHFYDWMAVILSTAFAASGMGYITSATYKQSTASTWAIVASFIASVFAGVDPNLRQVSRYPVVSWPWYLNYATWTAEATYFTWTRYLLNDGHVPVPLQEGADAYGYEIEGANGIARSVGAMIALGVGMRLLASWLLYRRVTKV